MPPLAKLLEGGPVSAGTLAAVLCVAELVTDSRCDCSCYQNHKCVESGLIVVLLSEFYVHAPVVFVNKLNGPQLQTRISRQYISECLSSSHCIGSCCCLAVVVTIVDLHALELARVLATSWLMGAGLAPSYRVQNDS